MRKAEKAQALGWRVPKGRWSRADGEAIVEAYKKSGLTMSAFAAKHGVPKHRISYWRARLAEIGPSRGFVAVHVRREPSKSPQGPSIHDEVKPQPEPTKAHLEHCIELELGSGRALRVTGQWPMKRQLGPDLGQGIGRSAGGIGMIGAGANVRVFMYRGPCDMRRQMEE